MAGRLDMKAFTIHIFALFFLFSPSSGAQSLEKYRILFKGGLIQTMITSDNGDFLVAAHPDSKIVRIYDAQNLSVRKTYAIPADIPITFGSETYPNIGQPAELSLYHDRYLSVTCYGGYIVHIDLNTDKIRWYKTSGSGNKENMFGWTGGYLRANQIFIHNDELKQIWYVNPITDVVSGPFPFEDDPSQMVEGHYVNVKFAVPKFIDIEVKNFRTQNSIAKFKITDLNPNDKYNFSSLLSSDNKYLIVNLYTSIRVYNLISKERIFYKSRTKSCPPNIFFSNSLVGFGGSFDDQLSVYNIETNKFLGKLHISDYASQVAANKTHLFLFRSMKVENQFVYILGSIPLNEILNNPSEYSVDVFKKFEGKSMTELKLLEQD